MDNPSENEKMIEQYLQENNTEAAVQLLYEMIVKNAREKNFAQAEALRDKLFEVDSMALSEIVKTGEIIEEEKSNAIDNRHISTWSRFYENLTQEETNNLFYGMQTAEFGENHMVVKQGEISTRLYFVDEGRLRMFYQLADKSNWLKTMGPGDIFGEATFFFSDAFCTTSVVTDSIVKLRVLEKEDLEKLNEKTPGLKSKIKDYCLKLESVSDLLKAKKLERRTSSRLNIPGKVLVRINTEQDQLERKPFTGELLNISTSGLAFIIKSTPKFARLMLGCELDMTLTFEELESDMEMNHIGTVVAVSKEPFNEFIFHLKYNKDIEAILIDDLKGIIRAFEEKNKFESLMTP